jgi:hypothetical protein
MTVSEMMAVIRAAHKKHAVITEKLWAQRDFKSWLKPFISRIDDIGLYRHFKITMQVCVLFRYLIVSNDCIVSNDMASVTTGCVVCLSSVTIDMLFAGRCGGGPD